jgi:hypothetical protein
MQYAWTGAWPANRSPRVESLLLDGKRGIDNIVLAPGQRVVANLQASDPKAGRSRMSGGSRARSS